MLSGTLNHSITGIIMFLVFLIQSTFHFLIQSNFPVSLLLKFSLTHWSCATIPLSEWKGVKIIYYRLLYVKNPPGAPSPPPAPPPPQHTQKKKEKRTVGVDLNPSRSNKEKRKKNLFTSTPTYLPCIT